MILVLAALPLQAQLSNNLFRQNTQLPQTKYGISFEALQFLKNNEYFNSINPGETLFGFQTKTQFHYRLNSNARFSAGALLQHDFGDERFFSKATPLFNLELRKKSWLFNLGNVQPHVLHNMNEAMLSYENTMRQPVELGLQALHETSKMRYDAWLHWQQKADGMRNRQEQIIFGQSWEQKLLKMGSITLSIPFQAIVFHNGGQALNLSSRVSTRMAGCVGLRLTNADTSFVLESFVFQSLDNSSTLSQPYQNGNASMTNLRFHPHKYHEIALTWWFAREFISPTGNSMFSNANLNDVYQNRNTRQFAMLRYVYSRPIVANKIWMDLRLEPYYDFQKKKTEMSQGLYFRYVEQIGVKLPRWMGM